MSPQNIHQVAGPHPLVPFLSGYQYTQMLYVVVKLGIADLLSNGPRDVDDLARNTGTHGPSLHRLLRTVAAAGLLVECDARSFALNEHSQHLREDHPYSMKHTVLQRGEDYYRTWGELLATIQTGESAYPRVFGMSNWSYRQSNPSANVRFNAFAAEMARQRAVALLSVTTFNDEDVVVDVGGGTGTLLMAVLERYPHARGVVFDLPHVIQGAQVRLLEAGLADRCTAVGGDVFSIIPSGGTVYMLSAVLHDWEDDHAIAILKRCREAMDEGARLTIIERSIPRTGAPYGAYLADLDMLVNTGGRERSENEWIDLVNAGGFSMESISSTDAGFYIMQATPAR